MKWSDRRFTFDLPVAWYPELIERLRGTSARVEERLHNVPVERLVMRRDGKWSPLEHAGHLADLDQWLVLPRLDDYDRGESVLRAADMQNRRTEDARHNFRAPRDVLHGFRAIRAAVIVRLEEMDAAQFARVARHPRLNVPMRLVDMLHFQAEHDDYHLARITELLRS